MSQDDIAATPSAVEIVEIHDPSLAGANIELIEQDVVLLQSSPLRARQVIVRLDGCIASTRHCCGRARDRRPSPRKP